MRRFRAVARDADAVGHVQRAERAQHGQHMQQQRLREVRRDVPSLRFCNNSRRYYSDRHSVLHSDQPMAWTEDEQWFESWGKVYDPVPLPGQSVGNMNSYVVSQHEFLESKGNKRFVLFSDLLDCPMSSLTPSLAGNNVTICIRLHTINDSLIIISSGLPLVQATTFTTCGKAATTSRAGRAHL